MSKRQFDYHKIRKAKVKQLTANIGVLAKEAKVKPSDFKNRKAYLNYVSRLAGFENYTQWQNARRKAKITPNRGGRGKHYEYLYTLKKFNRYELEKNVIRAYFEKANSIGNRKNEKKYFTIEWYAKEEKDGKRDVINWQSETSADMEYLFAWLDIKFEETSPKLKKRMGDKSKAKIFLLFYTSYHDSLHIIDYDNEPEILF